MQIFNRISYINKKKYVAIGKLKNIYIEGKFSRQYFDY